MSANTIQVSFLMDEMDRATRIEERSKNTRVEIHDKLSFWYGLVNDTNTLHEIGLKDVVPLLKLLEETANRLVDGEDMAYAYRKLTNDVLRSTEIPWPVRYGKDGGES